MGSGHFLVAAVDRIATRFSAFLVEYPLPAVAAELAALNTAAQLALRDSPLTADVDPSTLLRRQVARRCVYGLDLNAIAVELARLSLWIPTFVPGLPMSTLDHGLVQGNSLTGIATTSEVLDILDPRAPENQISMFEEQVNTALGEAGERLLRVARTAEATLQEVRDAGQAHQQARAAAANAKALFDTAVAVRLEAVPLPPTPAIAIARAELPAVQQQVAEVQAAHLPYLFPEVFSRANPGFDVILGNPPWEEATVEASKFWAVRFPGMRTDSADLASQVVRLRAERPDLVREFDREVAAAEAVRWALTHGPYPGMGTGDPDLYKAFIWRFWQVCRNGGSMGVVLPRSVFTTAGSAKWRQEVLPRAQVQIVLTKNKDEWLFTDVNPGYTICLVAITKGGETPSLQVRGVYHSVDQLRAGVATPATFLDVGRLAEIDPQLCVPAIENQEGLELFNLLIQQPVFGDTARTDFRVRPTTELHATKDGKVYFTHDPSDHPVYNHVNVGQYRFEPATKTFNWANYQRVTTDLHAKRPALARRKDAPTSIMPPGWTSTPETLPTHNPRIAFRDVVHASNPRKVWAALVPARTVLTNTAPYLLFGIGDVTRQAYLLGMLNSSPCDWFGHCRIGLHLNYFILNTIPIPVYDDSNTACPRIAELAARLGTGAQVGDYGDWTSFGAPISEPTEVAAALAEIDALTADLYGLNDEQLALVLDRPTRPTLSDVLPFRRHQAGRP